MVSFGKLPLRLFFFLFQFSKVISYSSLVAYGYKAIVYSFFMLKKLAFLSYNACNATLARSQTL